MQPRRRRLSATTAGGVVGSVVRRRQPISACSTRSHEKFDAKGEFEKYVEELRGVDPREIHDPSPMTRAACGYPEPIVDHKEAREHAIAAFKAIKKG